MVRGNKFKPKPAAAAAADACAATEEPQAAGAQPVARDPELGAVSRPAPQNGSLGHALAAGRCCGNGASEAPAPMLPGSRAGSNGCARHAGAGARKAKHRQDRGAHMEAAPAACSLAPALMRKAVQSGMRGACAEASLAARGIGATAPAPAHPARPEFGRAAPDARNAGKRKRQTAQAPANAAAHVPAGARPAAERPAPEPKPGGAAAPARKRRRGAPAAAAPAVLSPTGAAAQARPTAQGGASAEPAPAPAAVSTEVQPPGATGESPRPPGDLSQTRGMDHRLCMHARLSRMHVAAILAQLLPPQEQSRVC